MGERRRAIALAKQMKTRFVAECGRLQAAAPARTISLEGAIAKI